MVERGCISGGEETASLVRLEVEGLRMERAVGKEGAAWTRGRLEGREFAKWS